MKFLLLLLIILPLTNTTFAQETKKENISLEKRTETQVNRLTEKLELSKEQSNRLYELNINAAKEREAEKERLKEIRKAKADAHKTKVKSILTEKQYEQYLELRGAQKIKHRVKRKGKHKRKRKEQEEK